MTTILTQKNKQIIPEFEKKRQDFYEKVDGFSWHTLKNGTEPYALMDIHPMKAEEVAEIKEVTEKVAFIYDKTAELLRQLPDENLAELGYPTESIPYLREKVLPVEGVIRRLDLVKTKEGWKNFEINADTPTFIVECFRANGVAAKHFGLHDANGGMEERLAEWVTQTVLLSYKGQGMPKVVFTGEMTDAEDWGTPSYLSSLCKVPSEMVSLKDLRIVKGIGLFTSNGEKIDVLYRQTYPIEYLVEDRSDNGTLIGVELMKLVQQGKLAVINPLSAFLLQSKAVQAVIWALHGEGNVFFSEEEHEVIQNHFIPTYFSPKTFIEKGKKYVQKPVFGREGDTIIVFDEKGKALNANPLKNYDNHLKIYQEYCELPTKEVMTPYGKTKAHILFGSFVIGNEAGAVGIRAGKSDRSHVVL